MEDEEHVLFHCPEYDTCQQEFPDLLLGNMSVKNISDFVNQETNLLWNIIIIIIIIEVLSLLQSIPPTQANKQTQAQKKRGSMARKLLGANAKSYC